MPSQAAQALQKGFLLLSGPCTRWLLRLGLVVACTPSDHQSSSRTTAVPAACCMPAPLRFWRPVGLASAPLALSDRFSS